MHQLQLQRLVTQNLASCHYDYNTIVFIKFLLGGLKTYNTRVQECQNIAISESARYEIWKCHFHCNINMFNYQE